MPLLLSEFEAKAKKKRVRLSEFGRRGPEPRAADWSMQDFFDSPEQQAQMQELVNKLNDPSEFKARLNDAMYYSKWMGIAPGDAYSFAPTIKRVAFEGKPPPKLTLLEDAAQMAKELPQNIFRIGTLQMTGGLLAALKRAGKGFTGAGIFPDEAVQQLWETVEPSEPTDRRLEAPRQPLDIFKPAGPLPGAITAEAFSLTTRLPDVGTQIVNAKQQQLLEQQDRITLASAPITRLIRPVAQNVPQRGLAIGLAILTGSPMVALGLLSATEGGQAYQRQLDAGGSEAKAMLIGDLSAAVEGGFEFLVLPKILKGFEEGLTVREMGVIVAENAGQEGLTSYWQRFLEVVGVRTSEGMDFGAAAREGAWEGLKAMPEGAWVGGVMGGGETSLAMGIDAIAKGWAGTEAAQYEAREHPLGSEQIKAIIERIQKEGLTKEQHRRAIRDQEEAAEREEAQQFRHLKAIGEEARPKKEPTEAPLEARTPAVLPRTEEIGPEVPEGLKGTKIRGETLVERQARMAEERAVGKMSDFERLNLAQRLHTLSEAHQRITEQIRYQRKFEGQTGIPEVDAKDAENLRKNEELLRRIEDEQKQIRQRLKDGAEITPEAAEARPAAVPGVQAVPEPSQRAAPAVSPAAPEAKQPEAGKGKKRDILGGIEPVQQINKALKEAVEIRPLVEK
ncbi:MAG: hypothetical protein ACYS74_18140, partial [Planctomycetota bacterium]